MTCRQFPREVRLRPSPPRTLSGSETEEVAHLLHSRRFVDKAPAAVWAELLDEGRYLCSIRTMYRILKERNEVRERRLQRRHPQYEKPELLATASQPMLVLGHHQAQGTGQKVTIRSQSCSISSAARVSPRCRHQC